MHKYIIKSFKEQTTASHGRNSLCGASCQTTCTVVVAEPCRFGLPWIPLRKRHLRAATLAFQVPAQATTEELPGFRYRAVQKPKKRWCAHCCTWACRIQSRWHERRKSHMWYGVVSSPNNLFCVRPQGGTNSTWQGKACVVLWWQASKSAHPLPWHSASPTISQDSRSVPYC